MRYLCLSLILLFTVSCAHNDKSVCRHNAVNAAILHKAENQLDEVKVCLGYSSAEELWHAQAKYRKPGGEWVFLRQPPSFTNYESKQDNFDILTEFTIEEWLRGYLKVFQFSKREK